jgi:hypothetical protein
LEFNHKEHEELEGNKKRGGLKSDLFSLFFSYPPHFVPFVPFAVKFLFLSFSLISLADE